MNILLMIARRVHMLALIWYRHISQCIEYSESRLPVLGTVGVIGFPLYYLVWHDLFPQPYENLWLRLLGGLLFFPLIFIRRLQANHLTKCWLPIYFFSLMLYAIPFFFTFMLLKNESTPVWIASSVTATFLLMLLIDWASLFVIGIVGIALGCTAYHFTTAVPNWNQISGEHLAIYIFALTVGSVANIKLAWVRSERQKMLASAAGSLAHELRAPILSIMHSVEGIQLALPALLSAYQDGAPASIDEAQRRDRRLVTLETALASMHSEAIYTNTTISIMLMNAHSGKFNSSLYSKQSIATCINTAVALYPFGSDKESELINWENTDDFHFWGSDLLMTHVIFNLLKNSLYHITKAQRGEISIRIESSVLNNHLYFRDTGPGIPQEVLPHIFKRFFSWSVNDPQHYGLGMGLSFCHDVMESFRGSVICRSEVGSYTEFVLTLPALWSEGGC